MRKTNKIILFVLITAMMLLGIGYSAISNITLNIGGTVEAVPVEQGEEVIISETLETLGITNDNIGDYIDLGNDIVNYKETTEPTTDDWRILYVEDENNDGLNDSVYAILSYCLPVNTQNGDGNNYIPVEYTCSEDDYGVHTEDGDLDGFVSFLNNTSNWNGLENGISGATVTGSPSYNLIEKVYQLFGDIDTSHDCFDLFWPREEGYWLATVYAETVEDFENGLDIWALYGEGGWNPLSLQYSTIVGIRPVVKLPITTKAILANGVITIIK